jgi:hypothetical protein
MLHDRLTIKVWGAMNDDAADWAARLRHRIETVARWDCPHDVRVIIRDRQGNTILDTHADMEAEG